MTKLAVLSFLLLCSTSFSQELSHPANGRELIRAMHDHYNGTWYRNLTFRQQSQFFKNGKMDRVETWYEALKAPVGLVIKFGSKESGSGIVFRNDTMFVFKNDTMQIRIRRVHDLLVLGFDVYVDDPGTTIKRLEEAGYNLDRLSVEKGAAGTSYVVGDDEHGRFWITADTYLFTKMKKKDAKGNETEVQFNNYTRVGDGWLSPEVVMIRNGQTVMKEVYSDWRVDEELPASIFNVTSFQQTTW